MMVLTFNLARRNDVAYQHKWIRNACGYRGSFGDGWYRCSIYGQISRVLKVYAYVFVSNAPR